MKQFSTRKILFIFLFTLTSFSSNRLHAQTWAPDGAIWHTGIIESFFSVAQGYTTTTVISDTIIASHSCKLLESIYYDSNGSVRSTDSAYMYSDSGAVYHYRQSQFYTIYDFNADSGDVWTISVPYPSMFASGNPPDTLVTIFVDSVSVININGIDRKVQYVHSLTNDWRFENPIIEGIGSAGGIFPFIFDWLDQFIPYLRCYSDKLLTYQTNSFGLACNDVISEVSENEISNSIKLYPNPATDQLILEGMNSGIPDLTNIRIINSFGKEIKFQRIEKSKQLILVDVNSLPVGLYFILGTQFTRKFIVYH
jgi:hypothetical protein